MISKYICIFVYTAYTAKHRCCTELYNDKATHGPCTVGAPLTRRFTALDVLFMVIARTINMST